jgi:ribosomal protein S18 acetylase RimI-like enzyme
MSLTDYRPPAGSGEGELYYIHVPDRPRAVGQPVEFLTVGELLEDEPACRALWDMLSSCFKTRSKFLAIWPCVRYVAVHRRDGEVVGALLVSAPLNWQIDYVAVRPEWRGRGIAAALVAEAVNQALAREVPYVMLTSREGLRGLYEGVCGFTPVAARPSARPAISHSLAAVQAG